MAPAPTGRPFIAAVDWGTTHMRLWLLGEAGDILGEKRSGEGLQAAGEAGFGAILERHLAEMDAPRDLPAMICGMAGSRQGWVEAPYVTAPTSVDAVLSGAVPVPDASRPVRIVPGIAQRKSGMADVIRGEETQIAGVAPLVEGEKRTLCLPGTHSKWVETERSQVVSWRTYLTGELFALLAEKSILRHSLAGHGGAVDAASETFRDWCLRAIEAPAEFTARLFSIRASSLLFGLGPDDAAAALSGLLIGTEIGAARRSPGEEIVLLASGRLGELYREALALAGHPVRLVDAEEAVRAGLLAAGRRHFGQDAGGQRASA